MSGGVDSSVAAALLVERGYDVTGVMLKLWRGDAANANSGCCNVGAADDARRVADVLGIPFYVLNFADRFERSVVADFRAAYASGTTPNPCVRCNQWIKFDALLERADALGADYLATGHYARTRTTGGCVELRRGLDERKDQSYVLWMLNQDQLARCLFPVGEMRKTETRAIARGLGLRTASKPDSQEICFVHNGDVGSYVEEHMSEAAVPGDIVDTAGARVGRHRGIARYTVGQRKGLGVSLGAPVFVKEIDAATNTVVVGGRDELDVAVMRLAEVSAVADAPRRGDDVLIQHRAHGEVHAATVLSWSGGAAELRFTESVRAVAPGQSAAVYDPREPDRLVGGGIVVETVDAAAVA